jgi:dihydroflavonol-4-reductase
MKILLTGGTGFLGSTLWPLLKAQGHELKLLQRTESFAATKAGVPTVKGSLTDRDSIRRALEGVEVVYHLAGRVSRDPKDARLMYELHVEGTKLLLQEAHTAKVKRIVLASTSGAIGVSKTERVATEDDPYPIEVVGHWPYYTSKIFEEKLAISFCRDKQLPLVVLNPSLLLGPGDDRLSSTGDVVSFMNRDIPAMPSGGLSFVDVRDAADAFANALERGLLYERHLLGGANMKFSEFFERLSRLTDIPAPKLRLPSRLNILGAYALEKIAHKRGTDPGIDPQSVEMGECYFYIDSSQARRELGFHPRDPQETLAATVAYLKKQLPNQHRPTYRQVESGTGLR